MDFVALVVAQKIEIDTTVLCLFLMRYIKIRVEGRYVQILHVPPGEKLS